MANKYQSFFVLLLLCIIQSQCAEEPKGSNNNVTDAVSVSVAPTKAPAPVTEPPIVGTDMICNECDCNKGVIDCRNKNIDEFFTVADWIGVQNLKPSRVDMSLNNFSEVTVFPELPLSVLDLSHGQIDSFQKSPFKLLQLMTELDLSHNQITADALQPEVFKGKYMPEEYQPLRSMRKLKLSYNQLHSLHQDVFEHLPELEELRLDGNPLMVLDHVTVVAISSLALLKVLDLSNCQLKELPETSLHSPRKLQWLDLSSNNLQVVPSALEDAVSLTFLSLSENPIKVIETDSTVYKPFPRLPALLDLRLCHMPRLESIKARSMSGLVSLQALHINNNPALSFIDPTALERKDDIGEGMDWPPITELYIDHNNLSVIDSGLISRWDKLKFLDIQANPYLCDCSTQWMVDTLADVARRITNNLTSNIICHEPIEMRGKSLIHLEDIHRHMRCVDKYGDRPERDAAILIGTLIGVLITIPTVLGILLMYKRGYFGICGAGPAAFSRAFYKRAGTEEFM